MCPCPSRSPVAGFAVAVVREEGKWRCTAMDELARCASSTPPSPSCARSGRPGRCSGCSTWTTSSSWCCGRARAACSCSLSDAAAALDYDIAADALDLLRVDPPADDDDEVWPEGALDILADLGLPAAELQVIVGEVDLYPDEQLQMIAQRCGFADEFAAAARQILDSIAQ